METIELTKRQRKWLELLDLHDKCDNLYIDFKAIFPRRNESQEHKETCKEILVQYRETLKQLEAFNANS